MEDLQTVRVFFVIRLKRFDQTEDTMDIADFEKKSSFAPGQVKDFRGLEQPWTELAVKSKKGRAPRRSLSSLHIPGDDFEDEHERQRAKILEKNPDYTSSDDSELDIDQINDTFEARLNAIDVEEHALNKLNEGVQKMECVKKLVDKSRSLAMGTMVEPETSVSYVSSVPSIYQALSEAGLQFDENGMPIDPQLRARQMGLGHSNIVKGKLVLTDPVTGEPMQKRELVDVLGKKLPPREEEKKRRLKSETDALVSQIDAQLQDYANEARGHIRERSEEVRNALHERRTSQIQKRRKSSGDLDEGNVGKPRRGNKSRSGSK